MNKKVLMFVVVIFVIFSSFVFAECSEGVETTSHFLLSTGEITLNSCCENQNMCVFDPLITLSPFYSLNGDLIDSVSCFNDASVIYYNLTSGIKAYSCNDNEWDNWPCYYHGDSFNSLNSICCARDIYMILNEMGTEGSFICCYENECGYNNQCYTSGEVIDENYFCNGGSIEQFDCSNPDYVSNLCESPESTCNDGVDNDGDGFIDCLDDNCRSKSCGHLGSDNSALCESYQCVEKDCTDGLDNDEDGKIDCYDSDCLDKTCNSDDGGCLCVKEGNEYLAKETDCADDIDNDFKFDNNFIFGNPIWRIDCNDSDCNGKFCDNVEGCLCNYSLNINENKVEIGCADNEDNDKDGKIDCYDFDCNGKFCDDVEGCVCKYSFLGINNTIEVGCNDGLDNDGDGLVDCADKDCLWKAGNEAGALCEPSELSCGDGFDNDGNGFLDCADESCVDRFTSYDITSCVDSDGFNIYVKGNVYDFSEDYPYYIVYLNDSDINPESEEDTNFSIAPGSDYDFPPDYTPDVGYDSEPEIGIAPGSDVSFPTDSEDSSNTSSIDYTTNSGSDIGLEDNSPPIDDASTPEPEEDTGYIMAPGYIALHKNIPQVTLIKKDTYNVEDQCLNTTHLIEMQCSSDNLVGTLVKCPLGCNDGACLQASGEINVSLITLPNSGNLCQASETICYDGFDNDANGKSDCADDSCTNKICAFVNDRSNKICQNNQCLLPPGPGEAPGLIFDQADLLTFTYAKLSEALSKCELITIDNGANCDDSCLEKDKICTFADGGKKSCSEIGSTKCTCC